MYICHREGPSVSAINIMTFFKLQLLKLSTSKVSKMPSKRTRTSSRRTKKSPKKKEDPKNHHNEQDDDDEEDREVWPVLIIVIRVMIASWFIYSACDRFLRKDAWAKYITYQNA